MYTISSSSPEHQQRQHEGPSDDQPPQRSILSRIVAFCMMLVCGSLLVAAVIALVIFLMAPKDALKKYFGEVEEAFSEGLPEAFDRDTRSTQSAGESATEPGTTPVEGDLAKKAEPDADAAVTTQVPEPGTTVIAVNVGLVYRKIARRVLIAAAVLVTVAVVATIVYFAFFNQSLFSQTAHNVWSSIQQLGMEIRDGVLSVIGKIASLDWRGLWSQFVGFWQQVWAQMSDMLSWLFHKVFGGLGSQPAMTTLNTMTSS